MGKDNKVANDLSAMCRDQLDRILDADGSTQDAVSGVGGARKTEAVPGYWQLEDEVVILGANNTRIVLGRDRPHSMFSGYGGRGDTACGAIHITAGAHGQYAKDCDELGNKILAEPNMKADAATIYLSQKTDIDMNFGLAKGNVGLPKARSGIAIKADQIRIVGREGIKLITRTDDENSQGGNQNAVPGIDLIAGNRDTDLQPLVKGHALITEIGKMYKNMQDIAGILALVIFHQQTLETVMAAHGHQYFTIGPIPHGIQPDAAVAAVCSANASTRMGVGVPSLINNKINMMVDNLAKGIKPLNSEQGLNLVDIFFGQSGTLLSRYNNTN